MTASNKIAQWLDDHNVDARLLSFEDSVHSVEDAIRVSGYPLEQITKSIVMVDENGAMVMALVPARFRASSDRVRKCLGHVVRPRIAEADEVYEVLGQKIGGNAPLNLGEVQLIIDPLIFEQEWIITGGGDDRHLVYLKTEELRRVASFIEARVRK